MAKHQGTCVNHRFINQIVIQNLSLTQTTRKQFIHLENEDRKVGEATDIYKGFVFSGNILIITLCVIYQIYNHLALGPTACDCAQ